MSVQKVFSELCYSTPEFVKPSGELHQSRIAKAIGIPQPTVRRLLLSGDSEASTENINKIAEFFGVTSAEVRGESEIKGRKAKWVVFNKESIEKSIKNNSNIVAVPQYRNNALSAGYGSIALSETPDSEMYFKKSWLEYRGWKPSNLFVIYIRGESMQPKLHSGDVVLIHTGMEKITSGGVYAINDHGDLKIKRIVTDLDKVIIVSDNPSYNDIILSRDEADELLVLGKCVWHGSEFF